MLPKLFRDAGLRSRRSTRLIYAQSRRGGMIFETRVDVSSWTAVSHTLLSLDLQATLLELMRHDMVLMMTGRQTSRAKTT